MAHGEVIQGGYWVGLEPGDQSEITGAGLSLDELAESAVEQGRASCPKGGADCALRAYGINYKQGSGITVDCPHDCKSGEGATAGYEVIRDRLGASGVEVPTVEGLSIDAGLLGEERDAFWRAVRKGYPHDSRTWLNTPSYKLEEQGFI